VFIFVTPTYLWCRTIMWGGFVSQPAKEPGLTIGGASAAAAQLPALAITAQLNLKAVAGAQRPPNNQPDIIIHKVKTQPMTGEAVGPDRNIR
jgi:hypothetical protein